MYFKQLKLYTGQWKRVTFYPQEPTDNKQVISLQASGSFGSIRLFEIEGPDYSILQSESIFLKDAELIGQQKSEAALLLSFTLKENIRYSIEDLWSGISLKWQYTMFCVPTLRFRLEVEAGVEYAFFGIQFHMPFLKAYAVHLPLLNALIAKAEEGLPFMLHEEHLSSTPRMISLVNEIQSCRHAEGQYFVYLRVRVLELLRLVLEQMSSDQPPMHPSFRAEDMEKISRVRELVMAQVKHKPVLSMLAREVGLNTDKLKRGFRMLYGHSVLGFLREARMEQAQQLLQDSGLSIKEIAAEVGFSSLPSFTIAFKKRFGYSPRVVRKGRK